MRTTLLLLTLLVTTTFTGCAPTAVPGTEAAPDSALERVYVPVPHLSVYDAGVAHATGDVAANAGTATATETAGAVHAAARSTVRRLGTCRAGVTGRVVVGMTAQLSRRMVPHQESRIPTRLLPVCGT